MLSCPVLSASTGTTFEQCRFQKYGFSSGSEGNGMNNDKLLNIVWKDIRSTDVCMMVTLDGNQMRARPMAGLAMPENNSIWFFSNKNTHKDEEIKQNPCACLTFADMKGQTFVSVSGKMKCIFDTDLVHKLWNEGVATYFPDGPDDPNIVLLNFTPETGEYWDAPSNTVGMAIKFLETKVVGEQSDL